MTTAAVAAIMWIAMCWACWVLYTCPLTDSFELVGAVVKLLTRRKLRHIESKANPDETQSL